MPIFQVQIQEIANWSSLAEDVATKKLTKYLKIYQMYMALHMKFCLSFDSAGKDIDDTLENECMS